jgi:hypothetical protein
MMRHSQPQLQPQTTSKFILCSVAKFPGVDRVAKKGGGEGEGEGQRVWADNKNPEQTAG